MGATKQAMLEEIMSTCDQCGDLCNGPFVHKADCEMCGEEMKLCPACGDDICTHCQDVLERDD